MNDMDYCLSRITSQKQQLIQGINAAETALGHITLINAAKLYAQKSDLEKLPFTDSFRQEIIRNNKSFIECSSCNDSGIITIPGIFRIIDIIKEQTDIITNSIELSFSLLDYSKRTDIQSIQKQLTNIFLVIRNPDCITDNSALEYLQDSDSDNTTTLPGCIRKLHHNLLEMNRKLSPKTEFGAYCYILEPSDRYLVRSFMQGIGEVKNNDIMNDFPVTLAIRDKDILIIGYFSHKYTGNLFRIEMRGLSITVTISGLYTQLLTSVTGIFAPLNLVWRYHFSAGKKSNEMNVMSPPVKGSYHARSLDDAMQFFSEVGYHINRYAQDFSQCGKITG